MSEPRSCRICKVVTPGHLIPVLLPAQYLGDWHLCGICWGHLQRGFQRTTPEGAFEPFVSGRGFRFTPSQVRYYILAGLQPDLEWQQLVRDQLCDQLHELGADLEDARAASARGDWAAVLEAVRMLHGRAMVARRALERMLGTNVAADLPPLVRAVQAVGLLIREEEVDILPPGELRARMHVVLETLDRELLTFLEPPEGKPVPAEPDRDAPQGGVSRSSARSTLRS